MEQDDAAPYAICQVAIWPTFGFNECVTEVTVHHLEEALLKKARQEASRHHVSMNQVLVDALRRGLGGDFEPIRKTNLDHYDGDSDFGPDWEAFLEKDLKQVDIEQWS